MSVPSLDVGEPESAASEHDEPGQADDPEVDQAEEVEPAAAEPESGGVEPEAAEPESGGVEPEAAEPESGGVEPGSEDAPLELAAVVAVRDAYLDDLQRVTAEFTNFRRQTIKRNTELVAQAASRLATANCCPCSTPARPR